MSPGCSLCSRQQKALRVLVTSDPKSHYNAHKAIITKHIQGKYSTDNSLPRAKVSRIKKTPIAATNILHVQQQFFSSLPISVLLMVHMYCK